SLHPLNLLTIVNPWLFRYRLYMEGITNPVEQAFYFGPVVPIAAVWVALRRRQLAELRPVIAGLLALAAIALFLALGRCTGLCGYLPAIPPLDLLRVPARYSIALYFAGAVLAAIALADLAADPGPEVRLRVWWIWVVPALSALVGAVAIALRGA